MPGVRRIQLPVARVHTAGAMIFTQFFGREDDRIALNVVVLFHRCPAWGDLSPEITPQAR
jgi:hypothetical protein